MSDDIAKIKAVAYSKGYAAGRKRLANSISSERRTKELEAFQDRAFLAAIPFVMEAEGWTTNGKPISTIRERVNLAWSVAVEAAAKKAKS